MITMKEYLPEGTRAADTLKAAQQTKPNTDAAAKALAMFMTLSPDDQQKHLDYLTKTLGGDNDAWKVGKDYSAKNRKGLKDAQKKKDMPTLKKEMAECFPGTSDELLERMAESVSEAVAKKTVTAALTELFREEPIFSLLFGDVEEIDAAEVLADRINELEEDIAWYDDDNNRLYEEIRQEQSEQLSEDFIVSAQAAQKPCRRPHNIADDFEPDIENAILMETNIPARRNSSDPMSRRVAYLEQTSGGRPVVAPSGTASYLTETWHKTQT